MHTSTCGSSYILIIIVILDSMKAVCGRKKHINHSGIKIYKCMYGLNGFYNRLAKCNLSRDVLARETPKVFDDLVHPCDRMSYNLYYFPNMNVATKITVYRHCAGNTKGSVKPVQNR